MAAVLVRVSLWNSVLKDAMMMKRMCMSFAAGLVSLLLLPALASSDDTSSFSWSTYGSDSFYGYGLGNEYDGQTNWRGYTQGSMSAGFSCHKVYRHTQLDENTPVVVENTQCYDRTGIAYIVPDSSIIMIRLDETTVIRMPSELLFAFDSAAIGEESQAYLEETALMIREAGATTVKIVGHTDGIGEPNYNKRLSLLRATAVKNWLVNEGGLANVDFQVSGVGADEPRFEEVDSESGDIAEARQANRRVDIIYSTN
jgi:outer membrane protein OmpA-like peptidoglycan-associated protein